jgi:hypothetical protein
VGLAAAAAVATASAVRGAARGAVTTITSDDRASAVATPDAPRTPGLPFPVAFDGALFPTALPTAQRGHEPPLGWSRGILGHARASHGAASGVNGYLQRAVGGRFITT